ncbi:MAG TPA: HEAT repeat domain-containing protein [Vicinamibacterales bacterium]|nr:HEAT repeat domain-containing protein [Vicinamibacterales bacterium]
MDDVVSHLFLALALLLGVPDVVPQTPSPPQSVDASTFPPVSRALLATIDASYGQTLSKLGEPGVLRLIDALQRSRNPAAAPVLIWLMANGDVSVRARAVTALGHVAGAEGVPAIERFLAQSDRTPYDMSAAVEGLVASGAPSALPVLERVARSTAPQPVREAAAAVYVRLGKSGDPGARVRALLWEQPDTALERRVMAEGRAALPAVWQALASGSAESQRVAAALLGTFRDLGSIEPIVTALDRSPDAVTRAQLLFDLNMILLTEAAPAPASDRNTLAALHVQWLYGELRNLRVDNDIRAMVSGDKTLLVYPDRVTPPFAAAFGPAAAVLADSPADFVARVRGSACGVAFHAITAANGVARVATTVYLSNGRVANRVWISLYRRAGTGWVPVPVPSHQGLKTMLNEPNLLPTINRNYGAQHPLKILRLDLTMERVRVDFDARNLLSLHENIDTLNFGPLDDSYVPLLERYTRAESLTVRYAAEFESAQLTKQPNIDLWVGALGVRGEPRVQDLAVQVLREYLLPRVQSAGADLTASQHAELAVAATAPSAVDRRLLPTELPQLANVTTVRQWRQFAVVDVVFRSGGYVDRGYSMLFERRANGWVFLCLVRGWMS